MKKQCVSRCWEAQKDKCVCVCGGVNHGIIQREANKTRKLVHDNKILPVPDGFGKVVQGELFTCTV